MLRMSRLPNARFAPVFRLETQVFDQSKIAESAINARGSAPKKSAILFDRAINRVSPDEPQLLRPHDCRASVQHLHGFRRLALAQLQRIVVENVVKLSKC